jgi:hypothetical protein
MTSMRPATAVDLYWIPLGSGNHSVRLNGKVVEAASAFLERRSRCDLYHTALEVAVPEGRYVIEMTPIPDRRGRERGVVGEGTVGTRWAGRYRLFRYENRRWRDGAIPDVGDAVSGPVRVTSDEARAYAILQLVPSVPTPVWGRDELDAGEMWSSNSVISWLLASSGVDVDRLRAPSKGRAPGWNAGIVVARRDSISLSRRFERSI